MEFPHHYEVNAAASSGSSVMVSAEGLPDLETAAPAQFGGPGDKWSPESLLVAALADCFILTFKAVARASKLEWSDLSVRAAGTLDRVERVIQFTRFDLQAELEISEGMDPDRAERLLHKAEQGCLIRASLKAETHLEARVNRPG